MAVNPQLLPIPPRTKLRRNLFLLVLLGLAVYFLLPQFARIGHAFQVVSTLKIPLVALSLGAQALSYLSSGYLLKTVVKLAAKPVTVVDGALLMAGANSIGTPEAAYLEPSACFLLISSARCVLDDSENGFRFAALNSTLTTGN